MEGNRDVVGFIGDEGAAGCTYHQGGDYPSPETQSVDVVLASIHYFLLQTRVLEPSVLTIIRLYESALGFCRVYRRGRTFLQWLWCTHVDRPSTFTAVGIVSTTQGGKDGAFPPWTGPVFSPDDLKEHLVPWLYCWFLLGNNIIRQIICPLHLFTFQRELSLGLWALFSYTF